VYFLKVEINKIFSILLKNVIVVGAVKGLFASDQLV